MIIDTDIGGDIDDALTLAMALHSSAVNLLGITTVYIGNEWRCGIARQMLAAFGREDIPVFFGAEKPLMGTWGEASPGANHGVDFIIRTARERKITLLVIGPMTNIGLALAMAPDIVPNVEIYAMGGMVTRAHPEWNILCDPEAAQIVLNSGARVTLVGLDVTERCTLSKEESIALVAGENSEMLFLQGEMHKFFSNFSFLPTLHDPLTLLCLLQPDVCTYEMKNIQIETCGEFTRGISVDQRYPENASIRVAVDVKVDVAKKEICRLVRERV